MGRGKRVRYYDYDWIKVIATLGVFLYHCSMFFNPFPWHVKNNEVDTNGILVFSLFLGVWLMPLFFAISGISVTYSLNNRSTSNFIKERLVRLGVPLLFGIFILSPPQVYIERVTNYQFSGSFINFILHYFDGLYLDIGGRGNFAFSGLHLWYLLVLLVFSIISVPLFKTIARRKFRKSLFVLLPFLLFLSGVIETMGIGGWDIIFYFMTFIFGYYFLSSPEFKPALVSSFKWILPIALSTSVIYIVWFMIAFPKENSIQDIIFYAVKTVNCWSWILVIFYLGNKYLTFSNNFLKYTSEASMPFYVLHQPIIVAVGYFIYELSWPIAIKAFILTTTSFILIMLLYHFVIRNVKLLRLLFGLKG